MQIMSDTGFVSQIYLKLFTKNKRTTQLKNGQKI